MKKLAKILLCIFASVISLFLLLWAGLWIARAIVYSDYIKDKETVCTIPGLNNGFVPQGIAYAEDDIYIHSGYNGDTMELHITIGEEARKITPVDETGKVWEGHGGGVSCAKDYVYVASESKLIIFRYTELKNAKDGDRVASIGTFAVDTAASFCFADENNIYVGEFYRAGNYDTDPTHHYVTPAGDQHKALVLCYPLAADGSIADTYPLYSISIRDQVQGFAVKDDIFVLSSSWGVSTSKLDFYQGKKESGTTINISGKSVPLYYLDSTNHEKTIDMPAFSEGLDIVGDRVIVSFESACNRYIVGKFFFADKVVSYPIH